MDDIIAIIIILVGFGIKIFSSVRKKVEESGSSTGESWTPWNDGAAKPEPAEIFDQQDDGYTSAAAYLQAEKDAALLAAQRRYEEMAAQAAAINQAGNADEFSAVYKNENEPEFENDDTVQAVDWVELIRNNRTEAVVIAEILAKPASLR